MCKPIAISALMLRPVRSAQKTPRRSSGGVFLVQNRKKKRLLRAACLAFEAQARLFDAVYVTANND
jgi:hypothetical protein